MTEEFTDQQAPQDLVANSATLGDASVKVHEIEPAEEGRHKHLDGGGKQVAQSECRPALIQRVLDEPPILPWEDHDQFVQIFLSFEDHYKHLRSDLAYLWLMAATKAEFELVRIDRMQAAIIILKQRPAMTALALEVMLVDFDMPRDDPKVRQEAHETSQSYYKDPKFRENFKTKLLEGAGFGREAAAGAAYLQALPTLTKLDQLRKSAEKTRDKALKRLDALSVSTASLGHLPAAGNTVGLIVQKLVMPVEFKNGVYQAD